MTRWVKTPADLHRQPDVRRLPTGLRASYFGLFLIARRSHPLVGALVDQDLRPLSVRRMAELSKRPHSTLLRHIPALIRRGVLARDLAGVLSVPLVADIEPRFSRTTPNGSSPHGASPPGTSPTPTEAGQGSRRAGTAAVQNRLWEDDVGGPPWTDSGPPSTTHSFVEVEKLENDGASASQTPVDNRSQTPSSADGAPHSVGELFGRLRDMVDRPFTWDEPSMVDQLIPAEIHDDIARALLAKLCARVPKWRALLTVPRDRGTLKTLARVAPAVLRDALQQESLMPSASNPGAWLNGWLARSREEAS